MNTQPMHYRWAVKGTSTGENGLNYGSWFQIVTALNESAAIAEAIRITKVQGRATAHICTVTSVQHIGPATDHEIQQAYAHCGSTESV